MINKESKINQYAEKVANEVSDIASKKDNRTIDPMLVYECIKEEVDDTHIMDEVFTKTIHLLEDKYGVLFDVDKDIYL